MASDGRFLHSGRAQPLSAEDLDQAKGERAPAIRETGREHSKHHIASKPSAAQTPKGRDRGCTRAHTKETTQETYLKIKMKASLLTKTRFSGARLAIKAASRRSASVRMGARAEVGLFYSTSTGKFDALGDSGVSEGAGSAVCGRLGGGAHSLEPSRVRL